VEPEDLISSSFLNVELVNFFGSGERAAEDVLPTFIV